MKKTIATLSIVFFIACSNATLAQETQRSYYENGNVDTEGQFDENEQATGKWKFYYESGKLQATGNFEDGEQTGEWKTYYESGELETVSTYKNGEIVGEVQYYDLNGNAISEADYQLNLRKKELLGL